ncbi:MarR family transcriptional regulator [Microbacterium sp. LRZ72]|uniref:MarR family winged helix-turn-helix transcriptional regulator n=1 Tax=Microbacterium sp. LRZ72 TaxID=2942481 RepID=UPI0029A659B0|nr:MarR family transcriptional regulator [Microbacterium sp. LRZ72]MDX2376480.1 MarR family transcriptional regulator [Microbacterium sp. LRZ72]
MSDHAPASESTSETSALRMAVIRFSRRLRNERADDAMSDGKIAVLGSLMFRGPHTLGELAERERVSAPSMNRTVNCLEQDGYLTRTNDVEDRRRVIIALTDAGTAVVRETLRRRDAWLGDALASLSEQERRTLAEAAALMTRLAAR